MPSLLLDGYEEHCNVTAACYKLITGSIYNSLITSSPFNFTSKIMSNTAVVSWNKDRDRWEAVYNSFVLVSNSNPGIGGVDYIRNAIEGGRNQKAKKFNVTKINVIGMPAAQIGRGVSVHVEGDEQEQHVPEKRIEDEFSINERFDIMADYVDMVARKQLASAVITGEGGLGKSHTVMKTIRAAKLRDVSELEIGAKYNGAAGYVIVKGYSTAKGLYRTLYENRNQVIIFDDCDSILRDPNAVNVLKAALDSYDERIVSWNSEGFGSGDDLPSRFAFEGGVIFISNMSKEKIPQAVRSRALCADVCMTRSEVVERMHTIVKSEDFLPDFSAAHKAEAMEFVADNAFNPLVKQLNLRSLINVVKTRQAKPDAWKRLGLYAMANT